ncbi:cellulase family glycosylhydrolase [Chitinophaga arvensicola]|uniref:Carbohydrate binding module (Family 6) n=1 Tax=Chitinophaga arvensicola TaxID=29529 RepID=A0A1I0RM11_9BACT|nr:cellulase family glycosylhydrolase [Chitinophaga arvensicola]SEW42104.1 Carbohydrate binding module (family 6) [Chitinophaga arvensicola]
MQLSQLKFHVLAFTFFLAALSANGQGYLKTKGHIIVNEKNEKVILRGMGLGGWMLQEGYMFRLGNIGQQYKIRAKIQELIGPEKTQEFYDAWLTSHTNKLDIDSMAAWGFNSVRLPMHFDLYTLPVDQEPVAGQHTWLEKGFALTDSLLNWCKAHHMYLILDLHATPGGQGNDLPISDRHPEKPSLWESEANRDKTIALWRKLAERYANEPWIGGYDIINEPNWGFEDPEDKRGTKETKNIPLKKLMVDITKAIREVDKKHIIIIEGNGFGNNYHGILPAWDDNMVISFHKYGNFTDAGSIRNFLDLREQYNLPLWLGESGENSNNWFTNTIRMVESNDIGWAWWQLKKIGINNPLEIKVTPGYQAILDYWSGKGPAPAPAEAYRALMEFVGNTRLENNIYHKDVTDAMFRQVVSDKPIPFTPHVIKDKAVIRAVDYDLGRNGIAYNDLDTASYHYTPGVNTQGNRGYAYRNDGVDIRREDNGFVVFHIENGEWLQYTAQVAAAGNYTLQVKVKADTDSTGARLNISSNGKVLAGNVAVPSGDKEWQVITLKNIRLSKGENRLRVEFVQGGCVFSEIAFERK